MTDETQAVPDEAAEIPSTLTQEQEQRVEALWQARALLTHESTSSTMFGSGETLASPVPGKLFAYHLRTIADYIMTGDDGIVEARIEPAELDYAYAEPARCACDIAREFTTGEYPRRDGEFVALGPEMIASDFDVEHGETPDVIAYRGQNYVVQPAPEIPDGSLLAVDTDAVTITGTWSVPEPDATFAAEVGRPGPAERELDAKIIEDF